MGDVYGINLHSVPNNPKKYAPKPNLYAFFIALGLALLKDGGKICYIIPQTILTAGDLDVLRYHLSNDTTIEKIITFGGNLFVGRGLKQNKPVATSSLIFVVKKEQPSVDHKVTIVNYNEYNEKQSGDFAKYFNSHNKNTLEILQSDLQSNVDNWNFIKQQTLFFDLIKEYKFNTETLSKYYLHSVAQREFGDRFYFDGGLKLEEDKITDVETQDDFNVFNPKTNEYNRYTLSGLDLFYNKQEPLVVVQGSQGIEVFNNLYKIIWTTRFKNKFQFIKNKNLILNGNQSLVIASNNYNEMLYLLGLLNSNLNLFVLERNLKLPNEAIYLVSIKSIKQYIRIPKITSENQFIKDEIIKTMEQLLDLEKVTLRDVVNFNGVQMQQFNSVSVVGNSLVLDSMRLNIPENYIASVRDALQNKYFDKKGDPLLTEIRLSELKSLPVIDFEYQATLKDYIDDLVFALYFNIPITRVGIKYAAEIKQQCKSNEFYEYINTQK